MGSAGLRALLDRLDGPIAIFGQGAEWPEVGAAFWWPPETWRVVAADPRGRGVLVRRDGRRARWELRVSSWLARLPRWVHRWLAPIVRRLGFEPGGPEGALP